MILLSGSPTQIQYTVCTLAFAAALLCMVKPSLCATPFRPVVGDVSLQDPSMSSDATSLFSEAALSSIVRSLEVERDIKDQSKSTRTKLLNSVRPALHVPGGNTGCGDGSDYAFVTVPSVQNNTVPKLLYFFQGGGACWTEQTCKIKWPMWKPSVCFTNHKPEADVSKCSAADLLGSGVLDPNEDVLGIYANGWNVVFIPYCSGDVHIGQSSSAAWSSPTLQPNGFNGWANAMSAVEFGQQMVPNALHVAVMGCSAGAIAAPFWSVEIAKRFPNANVSTFSDSGGPGVPEGSPFLGIMQQVWNVSDALNSEISGVRTPADMDMAKWISNCLQKLQSWSFFAFSNEKDGVMAQYNRLVGNTKSISELMRKYFDQLLQTCPAGRIGTFLRLDNTKHCVTGDTSTFSDVVQGNVRLSSWVMQYVIQGLRIPQQQAGIGLSQAPSQSPSQPPSPSPEPRNSSTLLAMAISFLCAGCIAVGIILWQLKGK